MAFDPQDIVDGFDEPKLPAGLAVPDAAVILLTFPPLVAGGLGATYGASMPQLRALLALSLNTKATPAGPTFADVLDTIAGGSLRLVPAAGTLLADYRYKLGLNGNYQTVPLDGIIIVGDLNTAVYAYSVETAANNQSTTVRSTDFLMAPALPVGGAPTFVNFNDATNVVTLLPAPGQLTTDYLYKIGSVGAYVTVPLDGLITVGNITGQVFAYLPGNATRAASTLAGSPQFTANVALMPSVRFNAPVGGSTLSYGVPALLSATATDALGITGVEFFNGTVSIGTATANGSEYTLQWVPTSGSTANLMAKATNTAGLVGSATTFVLLKAAPVLSDPPTSVIALASGGKVSVGWTAPLNTGGAPITNYYVFRNGGPVPVGSGPLPYFTDLFALPSVPYFYEVAAYTSAGTSVHSVISNTLTLQPATVVATVPNAPIMGTPLANATSISVYFTPGAAIAGNPATSYYNIYRNNVLLLPPTPSTYYSDTTAVPGVSYSYTAVAVNSVGPSLFSNASAPAVSLTVAAVPVGVTSTAYVGTTGSSTPLAADVLLLAPKQFAAGPQTLSFACIGSYPCFAEVASNGGHASILDKNGFNVTGDIIKSSMVINAVSYNVYTHSNPQYDATFILKFL